MQTLQGFTAAELTATSWASVCDTHWPVFESRNHLQSGKGAPDKAPRPAFTKHTRKARNITDTQTPKLYSVNNFI